MELVNILEEEGLSFEVLLSPSALVVATVYSGFPSRVLLFGIFTSKEKREKENFRTTSLSSPRQ